MVKEKGTQAEERQDEPRLWRPWRPPRRRTAWRVLWAVGMVVAVLIAVLTTALLILDLPPEIWKGLSERWILLLVALGFSLTAIVVMLAIAGARRSWTGFQGKTVWDFLQLLIVPLMLVAIGLVFSLQQDARQQRVEDQRAGAERELAEQRAQDEALQAYLDQMSNLLLEKNLRESEEESEVRSLARARTLTVLARLDPRRKTAVMQFLVEAELVQRGEGGREPIIRLGRADLSGAFLFDTADLSGADLSGADLSKADLTGADLRDANLSCGDPRDSTGYCADLSGATLYDADLSGANLNGASLNDANLTRADLSGADLSNGAVLRNANLTRADLSGADLSLSSLIDANLTRADLSEAVLNATKFNRAILIEADLTGANLQVAHITQKQLEQAGSLEGAIMPNGSTYRQEGP